MWDAEMRRLCLPVRTCLVASRKLKRRQGRFEFLVYVVVLLIPYRSALARCAEWLVRSCCGESIGSEAFMNASLSVCGSWISLATKHSPQHLLRL